MSNTLTVTEVVNSLTVTPVNNTVEITTGISAGSTTTAGILQLTDSVSSTSTTTAATPNAVKSAYDFANSRHALLDPISGSYYRTPTNNTVSNNTSTANRTYYTAIQFSKSVTLDRIAIQTGASFSGTASVRLGIFENLNGKPGNLILDAGTVAPTALSTGYSITINQSLAAGVYWFANNTITAATTNTYFGTGNNNNNNINLFGGALSTTPGSSGIAGFQETYTATTAFANAGTVSANATMFFTFVRVA
jgi:hypothetical protein